MRRRFVRILKEGIRNFQRGKVVYLLYGTAPRTGPPHTSFGPEKEFSENNATIRLDSIETERMRHLYEASENTKSAKTNLSSINEAFGSEHASRATAKPSKHNKTVKTKYRESISAAGLFIARNRT